MTNDPPNFWSLFAQALDLSASKRSFIAFLPWWLLVCCLVPATAIFFSRPWIREHISDTNAVTVFSAIAVVAGFFGSVSIATMTQVQRMASEYPFSAYLRENQLLDLLFFWPQFTLMIQIALILLSTIAAATVRLFDFDELNQYIIAADIGLLIYVCSKTWNLIDLLRKVTWHYEEYQRLLAEERARQSDSKSSKTY